MPKETPFTQIVATHHGSGVALFALAGDGNVWQYHGGGTIRGDTQAAHWHQLTGFRRDPEEPGGPPGGLVT